jgi:hypothetical protein
MATGQQQLTYAGVKEAARLRAHTHVRRGPYERHQWGAHMGEDWVGLTVRARDGTVVGGVVGVFAEGPLAGRLRVEGAYASGGAARGPRDGIAVYAIPRHAVVGRQCDSLLLGVTRTVARGRWLMHVRQHNGP